ncbi:hypothetical protein Kisp01_31450 [Kineosporia sp. NBRC 101677]|nr:hypothetical protein Kisp01_31450 [Kineosporia sp. NBRC 101677]
MGLREVYIAYTWYAVYPMYTSSTRAWPAPRDRWRKSKKAPDDGPDLPQTPFAAALCVQAV